MPYADTDFLLALLKPDDWLKDAAHRVLRIHKGNIWTSLVAVAEAVMIGRGLGFDPEKMISDIVEIARLEENDERVALSAAVFMTRHRLSTFDAFHAALAMSNSIISSDKVFDKAGLKRIWTE